MHFSARIKTKEGNYIACSRGVYGKYAVYFTNPDMELIKPATIQEWVWASAEWDSPVEKGNFPSKCNTSDYLLNFEEEDRTTCYFGEYGTDEDILTEYFPVQQAKDEVKAVDQIFTYIFNNKQGNRDRACKYGIVHQGLFYEPRAAENCGLAVFTEKEYNKNGKWSNSTYEVQVKSARLIVCMSPFEGWSEDIEDCINHVIAESEGYIGYTPTREEAAIFFQNKYPNTYAKIMAKVEAKSNLL